MTGTTPRLGLMLLEPGQAQKEMTHNEALTLIDLMVQASVVEAGRDKPPAAPGIGDCWIVGDAPVGAWAGRAGALAGWSAGGWRFVPAVEGMAVWNRAAGVVARFRQGRWGGGAVPATAIEIGGMQVVGPRLAAIVPPKDGGIVDAEARGVIDEILSALSRHGLIG